MNIFDNCELQYCIKFTSVCKQWLKLLSEKRFHAALVSLKREKKLSIKLEKELTCTHYNMSHVCEQLWIPSVYKDICYFDDETDYFYDSFYSFY